MRPVNFRFLIAATLAASAATIPAACVREQGSARDAEAAIREIASFGHDEVLVAHDDPSDIADRLVTLVVASGELKDAARHREARALGKIVYRGSDWDYTLDERKAAIGAFLSACQSIHAELGSGERLPVEDTTIQLVAIALGAVEMSRDLRLKDYLQERLAELEPVELRLAFRYVTANTWFFAW